MKNKIVQLVFLIATSATAALAEAGQPAVVARVSLPSERFSGAVAKGNAFVLLAGDTIYAFSSSGTKLWEAQSQWCKFPKEKKLGEPPNFNRPNPVVFDHGVAVLNCRDWTLELETFDLEGRRTGAVQPVQHDMHIQEGILQLGSTGSALVFGYRLSSKQTGDNPDKGVVVFDTHLKKQYDHEAWGDRICCARDGSFYAPTVRWGKDLEWCRFTPDGEKHPLPESVSSHTWVLQPGVDSTVILWGSREDSTGKRPDGNLDSIGLRRIWQPSQVKAGIIHEFWKSWQGHVVTCGKGRYVLRTWPNSQQQFICLDSQGKTHWQHKLTLSCYFWPPEVLCDRGGNVYLMDIGKGEKPDMHRVLLRCLSPSGQIAWELPVDQTTKQPRFDSVLAESEAHLLLVRRDRRSGVELIFVALPETDTNGPNKAIDSDKE